MAMTETAVLQVEKREAVALRGYDYLEFYVGNARQAAHFYRTAFGFKQVAYAGLETGLRDRVSYVLEQGDIRLVLTSSLNPYDFISEHVRRHGDGVSDIAFTVDDVEQVFNQALLRGARPILEPTSLRDDEGEVVKATVATFGDTVHSFISRKDCQEKFLPGFLTTPNAPPPPFSSNLTTVDHMAISVEAHRLDEWVEFYQETLDFHESHREDVVTEFSAMNSKVVQNGSGSIKLTLVEPARGRRKSQVEEYIEFYGGAGVQHVALLSEDIIKTVKELRAAGNDFLVVPGTYYEMLEDRVGKIEEDTEELRKQQILVDRDEWGYLMQIFTRPVQSRPTVFMEAIERKGARGFGSGNIKALFAALEQDQARRGNL